MKLRYCTFRFLCLAAAAPVSLGAQPFLHNDEKDQKAQLAEAAAKEIASGAVFNTEIQNLNTISKLEIQRIISFAKVQLRSGINAFETWKDVSDQMTAVQNLLERSGRTLTQAEASSLVGDVKKKVGDLQTAIEKLKDPSASESSVIEEIQTHLNTASSALTFAGQLPIENQRFSAAIEHIKTWLDTANSLYESFAKAAAAKEEIRESLAKLSATPEADELRLPRFLRKALLNCRRSPQKWTTRFSIGRLCRRRSTSPTRCWRRCRTCARQWGKTARVTGSIFYGARLNVPGAAGT